MQLMGLNILINDEVMSDTVEDWSNVRSPSRAKRRMKRGFRQRVFYKKVPKKEILNFNGNLLMHSSMLSELKRKMNERAESSYITDDLSLRSWSKGQGKEYDFGSNFLWKGSSLLSPSQWIYRRDEFRQEAPIFRGQGA